jgi:hypothetical protein
MTRESVGRYAQGTCSILRARRAGSNHLPECGRRTIEKSSMSATSGANGARKRSFRELEKTFQKPSKKTSNIFPGQRQKTWRCAQIA